MDHCASAWQSAPGYSSGAAHCPQELQLQLLMSTNGSANIAPSIHKDRTTQRIVDSAKQLDHCQYG